MPLGLWPSNNGNRGTDSHAMADTPVDPPIKPAPDDLRRDRLRQALRDNLKRRKAQLRGRSQASDPPASGDDSGETD